MPAAERAGDELNTEFLMARNITFQPTHLINGPEGALYIADYYKGGDSGRIYRIVPEKFQLRKPPPLGKVPTPELVAMLAQTNGWHRDTAARLLYERQDAASVSLLTSMIQNSRLVLARVHALYLLASQGALREDLVLRALRDPDERLREHGLLLTERLLRDGAISDTVWNQLKMMPGDRSMRVVHQLALTLGEIRRSDRSQLLADILRRTYAIPMMQTAVLSSLNEGAGQVFVSLASDARVRNDPGAQPVLQQLLTMIGVKGREEEIAPVLDFVDRARLDPQQSFTMLHVLGEGLRRIGASFPVVDRNNRLQRFYDDSVLATLNDALPQPVRLAAIRFRGVSPYVATGTGDFFQLLFDPGAAQSEAVQVAAITTLGRYNNPNVPINFISRWQSLSPALRNEALAALLSRDDAVPLVVSAVQRGTIRLNEFSSVQMDFLRTYSDPAISQAAVNLFGPVAGERPGPLERFKPALRLTGAPARGRQTFLARCASCHQLAGEGQAVGPELIEVRNWGKERILLSIIAPNLEIRPQYRTHVLQTKGKENLIGVLTDQTPATITLKQPNGLEMVWPRGSLDAVTPQPWSLMPIGLEEGLSPGGMADLLEYISTAAR